jgi:hypothetical protein
MRGWIFQEVLPLRLIIIVVVVIIVQSLAKGTNLHCKRRAL